jgi:pilus assembly protein FimV
MHSRLLTAVLPALCCAVAGWATPAWAVGLGGSSGAAVIGQPLDVVVQARLDNGEALTPDCVGAEVSFGEQRVAAQAVRVAVEGAGSGAGSANAARIRVSTTVPVDEPVVDVLVNAGCGVRVSRRYLVLAAASNAALGNNASQTVIVRPVAIPNAIPNVVAPEAATSAAPVASNGIAKAPANVPVPTPVVRAQPKLAAAPVPTSRLRMDFADAAPDTEAVTIEQAMQAVAEAASAARAVAAAASAATQRANALEATVQELRAQAQAQLDVNERLRQQLAVSGSAARWTWLLAATSAALLALSVWLGRKVMRLQARAGGGPDSVGGATVSMLSGRGGPPSRLPQMSDAEVAASLAAAPPAANPALQTQAQARGQGSSNNGANGLQGANGRNSVPAWPAPAPAPAFSPPETWLPTLDSVVEPHTSPAALARKAPDRQDRPHRADGPESPVERTDPTLQNLQVARLALRDVSIEELIDLEQQADFFVALDQDEAAINLLNDHLRQTGGASPLPYLKLLEIFRRRGDRNDYERCRVRFNQRFNAYAPDWNVGLQSGRELESYPEVMPRLQQVWRRPLDSMAELEALLFRKSRGELFDLPAYREVLFLYAIARDLLDHEASGTGRVDVLLPIAGAASLSTPPTVFGATAPMAFMDTGPAGELDTALLDDGADTPTAPVDFDLSVEHGQTPSIFDPMQPSQALRRP